MCAKSFALGRWRGAMGRPRAVMLAALVDVVSYAEGHAVGCQERAERKLAVRGNGAAPARGRR